MQTTDRAVTAPQEVGSARVSVSDDHDMFRSSAPQPARHSAATLRKVRAPPHSSPPKHKWRSQVNLNVPVRGRLVGWGPGCASLGVRAWLCMSGGKTLILP